MLGCTFWDTAIHRWTNPGGDLGPNLTFSATFSQIDSSQYHTWGVLRTSSESGNSFTVCTYVDGVKQTCGTTSYPTSAWANLRNYLNVNIGAPSPNILRIIILNTSRYSPAQIGKTPAPTASALLLENDSSIPAKFCV
jgi:hypothetical protein